MRAGSVHLRSSFSIHWKALVVTSVLVLGVLGAGRAGRLYWRQRAPTPSGPSQSGTVRLGFVDHNRQDPYRADGGNRELLLQFWYPISPVRECRLADYTSPKVWAYLSQITDVTLPPVETNSCLGAAVAPGIYPVIIFSHGYTGMPTDETFLFEDLASRGYVVVSVAHTYEATAVEFPDGRLTKSVLGSFLEGELRADDQLLERALAVRLADLEFVLNELARLNSDSTSLFAGRLNIARVAVMGHSLGGMTALLSLEKEPRFRAAVMIDVPVLPWESVTRKPVLIIKAGRDRWTDEECKLWSNLRGPRFAINLSGAEHLTPTDAVWLMRFIPGLTVSAGKMGSEKTIALMRNYAAAFFDTHLLGWPPGSPLRTGSQAYPDADPVTQQNAPCSEESPAMKERVP